MKSAAFNSEVSEDLPNEKNSWVFTELVWLSVGLIVDLASKRYVGNVSS
jgi:hypothetical protein